MKNRMFLFEKQFGRLLYGSGISVRYVGFDPLPTNEIIRIHEIHNPKFHDWQLIYMSTTRELNAMVQDCRLMYNTASASVFVVTLISDLIHTRRARSSEFKVQPIDFQSLEANHILFSNYKPFHYFSALDLLVMHSDREIFCVPGSILALNLIEFSSPREKENSIFTSGKIRKLRVVAISDKVYASKGMRSSIQCELII